VALFYYRQTPPQPFPPPPRHITAKSFNFGLWRLVKADNNPLKNGVDSWFYEMEKGVMEW